MKQNNPYKPRKACARCYPAVALLALLLAGACTQDDAPTVGYGLSGEKTSLQVAELGTADEVTTRFVTAYPTTGTIGFFVKADATGGYAAINNRKGVYEGTTHRRWLPVDSIWLNNTTANLAVYAPYDATTHGTAGTLKLAAALRPADGSKDIAFKAFTANHTTAAPALTLDHLYARMHITITRAAEYNVDVALSTVKLQGNETYKEAIYRPFDASHYAYGADNQTTIAVSPEVKINASTTTATIDLLLIPATLTGDITLRLEGTDNQFKTVIAKTGIGNALQAGKQYNLNLKLRPGKIDLTSVSVEKWNALAAVNGGNVEFDEKLASSDINIPKDEITLNNGDLTEVEKNTLSDLCWASGNLTLGAGGDLTGNYAFVDKQEKYGYFFQFNKLADGTTGDPCTKVQEKYGTGWRIPTDAELRALSHSIASTDSETFNGVSGKWFMAPAPNGLFLPDAGWRNGSSGSTSDNKTGTNGYYWSSVIRSGSTNAYHLSFWSGICGVFWTFSPDLGLSVRCVKNK